MKPLLIAAGIVILVAGFGGFLAAPYLISDSLASLVVRALLIAVAFLVGAPLLYAGFRLRRNPAPRGPSGPP